MALELVGTVGAAFTQFLRGFREFFPSTETLTHFDHYVRGLLSDLPRKTVEPIALAGGSVVRSLQQFLKVCRWEQQGLVNATQQRLEQGLSHEPLDPLGTLGVVDETSSLKKGNKTPGGVSLRHVAHTGREKKVPALTLEQVCRALHYVCGKWLRRRRGTVEGQYLEDLIAYHQARNAAATRSHKKRPRIITVFTAL